MQHMSRGVKVVTSRHHFSDVLFVARIKHVDSVSQNTQGLRAMQWRWNKHTESNATFTYH